MSDAFKLAPHEWAALRALLDQALDLPEAERAAWLDRLDDGRHGAYKPRLRSLLQHATDNDHAAQRLLHTLPKVETDQFAPALPGGARDAAGDRVGPYRLLRELGSGGMASVWLAERTDMLHGRQVALKLPHGAWRRAGLAERLAREREILATLEHPNIARLYDAGVADDGQPYLALEHVQGERIDAYCERKQLALRERLQLFLQVARAVAYAHAQLVVHRDLKPSNILVTEGGEVKLLDFGIAKLLEQGQQAQATALTEQVGRALTPDYAAPEQILGQPIGTAADVYALGVVLYELLAGRRPYQLKRDTAAALEEAIVQADPPWPSSVAPEARRKALRGDLDTIVLKALKKGPAERYPTVQALADDLLRWIERRPVLARPDSAAYRLQRYVERHLLAVAAAAAVAVALLAGAAVAGWQARVARAAEAQARTDAELTRQAARVTDASLRLAEYMLVDMSAGRSPDEIERQLDRAAAATRAQHTDDPRVRATLLASIAGRLRQFNRMERYRSVAAEALADARIANDGDLVAHIECWFAIDIAEAGDVRGALTRIDSMLAALREGTLRSLDATGVTQTLRSCMLDRAWVLQIGGDLSAAIATIREAQAFERERGIRDLEAIADTQMRLSLTLNAAGLHADALQAAREALATHARAGREASASGFNARQALARTLLAGGQPLLALEALTPLKEGPQGALPAPADGLLAVVLVGSGRNADALAVAQGAWQSAQARGDRGAAQALARTAAEACRRLGRLEEARAWLARDDSAPGTRAPVFRDRWPLLARARQQLAEDRAAQAQSIASQVEALMAGGAPSDSAWRALKNLQSRIALARNDPQGALRHADAALALARAQAIDATASVWIAEDQLLRAEVFASMGQAAQSSTAAREAVAQFERSADPAHDGLAVARRLAAATN